MHLCMHHCMAPNFYIYLWNWFSLAKLIDKLTYFVKDGIFRFTVSSCLNTRCETHESTTYSDCSYWRNAWSKFWLMHEWIPCIYQHAWKPVVKGVAFCTCKLKHTHLYFCWEGDICNCNGTNPFFNWGDAFYAILNYSMLI